MLAYIRGSLEVKTRTYVVIDVSGLGYKVFMSENNIDKLGEIGEVVKVHTYYRVREDDISIFGFTTQEELRMFELLISVSGVGAKSALTMLANISPSSFAISVISNDVSNLVKIPGIGAKTAQRIILELKDKLKQEQSTSEITKELKVAMTDSCKVSEAVSALQVLGYTRKEIDKALDKVDVKTLSVEDIIRKGLAVLSR